MKVIAAAMLALMPCAALGQERLCEGYGGLPPGSEPTAGMVGDPRRRLHHGRRRRAARGASRAPGRRGPVLDRPARGHQRPVRALRRGHGLPHRRRARALGRRGPPGLPPELLAPGASVFSPPRRHAAARRCPRVVAVRRRGRLAAPGRARQLDRRQGEPPGGRRRLRGRAGLRALARPRPADRGPVGVRRPRRARRQHLRLGRHVLRPRGRMAGQHLAGGVPVAGQRRRRLPRGRAGRLLRAERLRPVRHDRQCLGVRARLVAAGPSGGARHRPGRARRRIWPHGTAERPGPRW